jgi:hypothetical protein
MVGWWEVQVETGTWSVSVTVGIIQVETGTSGVPAGLESFI